MRLIAFVSHIGLEWEALRDRVPNCGRLSCGTGFSLFHSLQGNNCTTWVGMRKLPVDTLQIHCQARRMTSKGRNRIKGIGATIDFHDLIKELSLQIRPTICSLCFLVTYSMPLMHVRGPKPAEPYPGGTPWKIDNPEAISNADIRDTGTGEKGEEKPEDAGAGETEEQEREDRESESGTESGTDEGTKA
ncbi:hypothetical protein NDU88_006279 [Pleurodeles waltl]|uniref:Uncharacterized protein n=1 Tax=Pleurodeles waltl TaxID=8319 RepID=A0AAV7N0T4_PLEWA|nr:hypothetical protein NDU88_006279 [Pleurodeles waltl]